MEGTATPAMDADRMAAVMVAAAANRAAREAVAAADAAVSRDCGNRSCRFNILGNHCMACVPIIQVCGKRRELQVLQTA